jgi:hypothetical protein
MTRPQTLTAALVPTPGASLGSSLATLKSLPFVPMLSMRAIYGLALVTVRVPKLVVLAGGLIRATELNLIGATATVGLTLWQKNAGILIGVSRSRLDR